MASLGDLLTRGTPVAGHRPWPRVLVDTDTWDSVTVEFQQGRWTMLGLWGEPDTVHTAALVNATSEIAVFSLPCPEQQYPSIAEAHPPALRLERAAADLFGLRPLGLPDPRPWLDHGRWGITHPLAALPDNEPHAPYPFLTAEGDGLHQIPVGPVHAGIIEPGHFRFTAAGETVVRLEERLGYTHKGIEGLMRGAALSHAARLAGRVSGDSTVAYALAFAEAAEAALGIAIPPRAGALRIVMAELERLANHFGDIGAICNDAAFPVMLTQMGILRERTLRAADTAFGHRLMRDRVVPGGIAIDIDRAGIEAIRTLLAEAGRRFPSLIGVYDRAPSIQDRVHGTGIVPPSFAWIYGAGGFVGRASGRHFDARRLPGSTYADLAFEVPVADDGDVSARVWIRIQEVTASLGLITQILDALPAGPILTDIPAGGGEGMALIESFRGDVLVWLSLDTDGLVRRCHLRDPSWFQWPLLEGCIEGNIVADFPLCNKSFNCSYSGHDL